jgi:glycosyltransferase involved in cell wall biosynthesis
MRIGLLTTSFPRFEGDAAGTFVLGFARALATRGHRVEVLAPEPAEPCVPVPRWPGVRVRHVPYLRPRSLQRTFYGAGVPDNLRTDGRAWLGAPPFVASLLRAAHRGAPHWDAVVSHWALPCGLVARAVAGHRPHLAVFHSADVHLLERIPGRRALAGRIAGGASSLQFVSRDLQGRFLALLAEPLRGPARDRSFVQPMGVDAPPPAAPDRDALRASLGASGFTVLCLGRLVPIKAVDVAVRAVADLPGAELIVAGDGPRRAPLEQLARRLGAPVRFVGSIHGADKHRWLQAADAFVAPSRTLGGRTEGCPAAVLEAMAAGLPVVATPTGGLADIVEDHRTGLRVPPEDVGALTRALTRLRDTPDLAARLGRSARQAAAPHHWPTLAPLLESRLLSSSRPGCPWGPGTESAHRAPRDRTEGP